MELFLDTTGTKEISEFKSPKDWLKFKDTKTYKERINSAEKTSNETEALVVMEGAINKLPLVAAAGIFILQCYLYTVNKLTHRKM